MFLERTAGKPPKGSSSCMGSEGRLRYSIPEMTYCSPERWPAVLCSWAFTWKETDGWTIGRQVGGGGMMLWLMFRQEALSYTIRGFYNDKSNQPKHSWWPHLILGMLQISFKNDLNNMSKSSICCTQKCTIPEHNFLCSFQSLDCPHFLLSHWLSSHYA